MILVVEIPEQEPTAMTLVKGQVVQLEVEGICMVEEDTYVNVKPVPNLVFSSFPDLVVKKVRIQKDGDCTCSFEYRKGAVVGIGQLDLTSARLAPSFTL